MALERFGFTSRASTSAAREDDDLDVVIDREIQNAISSDKKRKRGNYTFYSAELSFKIGKYAAENGNKAAGKKFKKDDGTPVHEATVRNFKKQYLAKLRSGGEGSSLPKLQKGRRRLLPEKIEEELKKRIAVMRAKGGVVNSWIVIATARGLLKKKEPMLEKVITLKREWGWSFLNKMGYVKRKG